MCQHNLSKDLFIGARIVHSPPPNVHPAAATASARARRFDTRIPSRPIHSSRLVQRPSACAYRKNEFLASGIAFILCLRASGAMNKKGHLSDIFTKAQCFSVTTNPRHESTDSTCFCQRQLCHAGRRKARVKGRAQESANHYCSLCRGDARSEVINEHCCVPNATSLSSRSLVVLTYNAQLCFSSPSWLKLMLGGTVSMQF